MTMIKERLNQIRVPGKMGKKKTALILAGVFIIGMALGSFSKWLDCLELNGGIWWHRLIETFDLGNFFSDFAVWLLAALAIAVFSASARRAALNVFAFFAGMCASYHICSILFGGFNPASYMMFWYGVTLLSPFLAALCWYAKGEGAPAVILDIGIIAVFAAACFSIGLFYVSFRGLLYSLVFVGAAAVLYKTPKQLAVSLFCGFALSFLLCRFLPFG
ncbi:MAG: hypothetical protein ACOX8R_01785 [Bacillota bacterium]|jgi:hypothetical protein